MKNGLLSTFILKCYLSNLIFGWSNYIDKHVELATPEIMFLQELLAQPTFTEIPVANNVDVLACSGER